LFTVWVYVDLLHTCLSCSFVPFAVRLIFVVDLVVVGSPLIYVTTLLYVLLIWTNSLVTFLLFDLFVPVVVPVPVYTDSTLLRSFPPLGDWLFWFFAFRYVLPQLFV
jgi:hypothetical protein